MKRILFRITLILFLGIATLAFNMQLVQAAPQVNILTHSGWLDSLGYYHVSGEVENIGDSTAGYIQIIATFYDSSNTVVATSQTFAYLNVLLPERKSPFEIILADATQAAKVHHYSLSITFSAASPIPMGLVILSNSSYIDILGFMHVVGELQNIASEEATYVKVMATFYNTSGHVVATGITFTNPSNIGPNQKALFEIILTYNNRVPLVASYVLTAESQQYAMVPEFPIWSLTILIFIVAAVLIAIYKRLLRKNTISIRI